jgi:hypothetical protein
MTKKQDTRDKKQTNFKRQVSKGTTGIKASPWPSSGLMSGDALRKGNSDDSILELWEKKQETRDNDQIKSKLQETSYKRGYEGKGVSVQIGYMDNK